MGGCQCRLNRKVRSDPASSPPPVCLFVQCCLTGAAYMSDLMAAAVVGEVGGLEGRTGYDRGGGSLGLERGKLATLPPRWQVFVSARP